MEQVRDGALSLDSVSEQIISADPREFDASLYLGSVMLPAKTITHSLLSQKKILEEALEILKKALAEPDSHPKVMELWASRKAFLCAEIGITEDDPDVDARLLGHPAAGLGQGRQLLA